MERRIVEIPSDAIKRFWEQVKRMDTCWVWTGDLLRSGSYGRMMVNGERFLTHRLSYAIHNGFLPICDGEGKPLIICHHCDNKPCIRPDHLYIGTHSRNTRDAIERGLVSPMNGQPFGPDHPNAKLSWNQAEEIRCLYEAGGITQRQLGAKFGICQAQVSQIVSGRAYVKAKSA